MWGSRVHSALFIDYENASSYCRPDKIMTWVRWLENGEFDKESKKRKLIEKRVYLNWTQQRYQETFEQEDFIVVICERLTQEKNGLDITIALDIMESLAHSSSAPTLPGERRDQKPISRKWKVDEYIILAKDSDYVPVLQRIQLYEKQSVILADEDRQNTYTAFNQHADIVIPTRIFKEAASYPDPERMLVRARKSVAAIAERFARRFKARDDVLTARPPVQQTASPPAALPPAPSQSTQAPAAQQQPPQDAMDGAVRATIRATSLSPNKYTAHAKIKRELGKIKGFSTRGPQAYFGMLTFEALMREVANRDSRIKVDGTRPLGVRYQP